MQGFVYKTTNLINGKIYIGQRSYSTYEYQNQYYLGSGTTLVKAIKKYGRENFSREILCECQTIEEMNDREYYYIEHFNSRDRTIGYNINFGGEVGKMSDETKKKLSESTKKRLSIKENHPNFGKKYTEERCKIMSEMQKGRTASDETKQKMSISHKGITPDQSFRTDEWNSKQSTSQISAERINKKNVNIYKDNILIDTLSMRQANIKYNINRTWLREKLNKSNGKCQIKEYWIELV